MKRLVDFTNKHILVIGGTGGIGRAAAERLSALGARVGLMSRDETALAETLAALGDGGHYSRALDVSELSGIGGAIAETAERRGAFDGLLYTAGEMLCAPLPELDPARLQALFAVNCFGFVEAVRQITAPGRFRPGLRIVGVSSATAVSGADWQGAFSASKAAMDGAVRSLAIELAQKDVCINTVAPGLTDTAMLRTQLALHAEDGAGRGFDYHSRKQSLGLARPEDIANAAVFLLSSAARMTTGASVPVDSGLTTTP